METQIVVKDVYTLEFLKIITALGMSNHVLTLKVDISVMVLYNVDQSCGLYNNTRLIITHLGNM